MNSLNRKLEIQVINRIYNISLNSLLTFSIYFQGLPSPTSTLPMLSSLENPHSPHPNLVTVAVEAITTLDTLLSPVQAERVRSVFSRQNRQPIRYGGYRIGLLLLEAIFPTNYRDGIDLSNEQWLQLQCILFGHHPAPDHQTEETTWKAAKNAAKKN